MKRILGILFLCAVCCSVGAFTFEEIKDAACRIPDKYLLRFFQCVYDESTPLIQKHADEMRVCIDYFHNTTEMSESILYYMCDFDMNKAGVLAMCFYGATMDLEPIKSTEEEEFKNTVKNCLFSAK